MRHLNTSRNIAFACALALSAAVASTPAMAKNKDAEHVRGVVASTSDSGFTIKTDDGEMRKVMLGSGTRVNTVTPGDLSNIKPGTFIGTANVERDGNHQALEMVIFPDSMKGTGLGNYDWDMSPSMAKQLSAGSSQTAGSKTADDSSIPSKSSMTNGTVTSSNSSNSSNSGSKTAGSSMTNGTVTSKNSGSMNSDSSMTNGTVKSKSADGESIPSKSSMTNGTVSQSKSGGDTMTLKVDYGDGSKIIEVPADVPTVKVQQGEKSDIVKGAHVFVAGPMKDDSLDAKFVAVGLNGTVPPM